MVCKPAIASLSLGRAWNHHLPAKFDQAARYGFDIELFYEDLWYVAKRYDGGPTAENQMDAAYYIRSLCQERGIAIICLGPFMHYEGLRDRHAHAERIEEIKLWFQLAKILGTHTIAIPSSFLSHEEASGDVDLITSDLQEVADLGACEGVELAYEALAWGTHVDTWEKCYDIVCRVNRPNFKICFDTYNFAGRVYADPTSVTGKTPNAESDMAASLKRLVETVDVQKISFVQVVDAERLVEPLRDGHSFYNAEQRPRMSWSRNCRLFYGEENRGAYLPIKSILKALLVDLGFRGSISAELFHRSLNDPDPSVPEDHASRAAVSWQKIVAGFDLDRKMVASASTVCLGAEPTHRAEQTHRTVQTHRAQL